MVVFPNCKINIGLYITGKRPDCYHNLATVFFPLPLKDVLEIIATDKPGGEVEFTSSGLPVSGKAEDNFCVKAYHLLRKDFPAIPFINMHLHKAIPMGAGLGGGSADAAFTLQLLNDKFNLGIDKPTLLDYALQLGSDCPFFIQNQPCFATGRGELLQPIDLDLSAYHFLLVNPGIHVSTAEAFSKISISNNGEDLLQQIAQPVETWQQNISNEFEIPVFELYPEIAAIKQQLYDAAAVYASMSGSGSSVYGIFTAETRPQLNFPAHYFFSWI